MINKKNIKNLLLNNIYNYITLFEDSSSIYNISSEFFNEYKFFNKEAKNFIDNNFRESNNNIILGLTNFETYGNQIFVGFEKGDYRTYLATRSNEYLKFYHYYNLYVVEKQIYKNNLIYILL